MWASGRASALRNILMKYVRIFSTIVKYHKLFIWDSPSFSRSLLIFKKIYAFARDYLSGAADNPRVRKVLRLISSLEMTNGNCGYVLSSFHALSAVPSRIRQVGVELSRKFIFRRTRRKSCPPLFFPTPPGKPDTPAFHCLPLAKGLTPTGGYGGPSEKELVWPTLFSPDCCARPRFVYFSSLPTVA